ncbi:MAG: recombinase family protein [Candidatus Saccharimonadia bacterium]
MGNAVIYTRVSTTEQAENRQSLDSQEKACLEFAAKRDMRVEAVFREEGESAKTADRTKLLEMIKFCQDNRGKIKYAIVFKVDRFARRAEDHLTLKAMLMQLGVQLLSATEPIENTNTGKLMETILAGFAEFDNGVRAERSSGGMKARLEEGGWVHLAPIGYRNVKDSLKRPTLEPDEMASKVQKFLKEFNKGIYTQKQAVELARKFGVKTKSGRHISANGVYKMIRNPVYAGIVAGRMLSEPVEGLHEGLISTEEHRSIIGIINGRRKTIKPSSRGKPKWPLRQFIRCYKCNERVTASGSRGRSKVYDYYHCSKCKGGLRVSMEKVHDEFEALLKKVKPGSYTLKLFREITLRRWNEEFKEVQDKRRAIDSEIFRLEESRQLVHDRSIDGRINDEIMVEQLDRIKSRKAALIIERGELYVGELEKELIIDVVIIFMADAAHLWKVSDLADRQRFQKMIYPDGIQYFSDGGFGTALMGLCYQEVELIEAEKSKQVAVVGVARAEESILVVPRGIEPLLPG